MSATLANQIAVIDTQLADSQTAGSFTVAQLTGSFDTSTRTDLPASALTQMITFVGLNRKCA